MTAGKTRTKSVVILNDMLFGGGRERRIVQLVAGLNKMGVRDITLILLDERIDYPQIHDLDVKIIVIRRRHNRDLSVFPKLYNILRELRPCVVNPWSFMTTFYAAPICFLLRIACVGAFVVDAKRPRILSVNWFAMYMGFALCNRIIGNSRAGHEAYRTPKTKRIVIYNGFDRSRLSNIKNAIQTRHILKIAMIGRLDRQKDYKTYIDAVNLLEQFGIKFKAFIVGQGGDFDFLRNYALAHCKHQVEFTGFIADVDRFISELDIGVLCTNPKYHAEGISNALMEMMAQGRAVVATNGGGTPELIRDRVNGLLIPAHDSSALFDRLKQLCSNSALRGTLGERAAETIATDFTLSKMSYEFDRVYNECF